MGEASFGRVGDTQCTPATAGDEFVAVQKVHAPIPTLGYTNSEVAAGEAGRFIVLVDGHWRWLGEETELGVLEAAALVVYQLHADHVGQRRCQPDCEQWLVQRAAAAFDPFGGRVNGQPLRVSLHVVDLGRKHRRDTGAEHPITGGELHGCTFLCVLRGKNWCRRLDHTIA